MVVIVFHTAYYFGNSDNSFSGWKIQFTSLLQEGCYLSPLSVDWMEVRYVKRLTCNWHNANQMQNIDVNSTTGTWGESLELGEIDSADCCDRIKGLNLQFTDSQWQKLEAKSLINAPLCATQELSTEKKGKRNRCCFHRKPEHEPPDSERTVSSLKSLVFYWTQVTRT